MIVRTYARRARCGVGRSFSDPVLLDGDSSPGGGGGGAAEDAEFLDLPPSHDGPQDRHALAAFSSQDSSSWSLDPADPCPALIRPEPDDLSLLLLGDSSDGPQKPVKRPRNSKREVNNPPTRLAGAAAAAATATLMEAQEFGEMMEHMDEVNFALDGLRPGQPARIRRASLLSLLSICGTVQQRRRLRAQGMAKRIVDAILCLNFDDSPSTVAAAALFYVLASDVQDDHLLDSPSCIHFLLKLLNPPVDDTMEDKATTIGSKILGIRKPHILSGANKETGSSSKAIMSKVQEILLSCKEIKSRNGDDEGIERPELSSKWIALLTMEKACLSTVSFEDTSDMVRRVGGNFKERLRELGGLDAIFVVLASCHSSLKACLKHNSAFLLESKDGSALQSVILILKCLKIMENATFLSKDNQDHLLGMQKRLDSEGPPLPFVGVMIRVIKFFSELSLLQNYSSISKKEKPNSSEAQMNDNQRDRGDRNMTSDYAGCSGVEKNFNGKSIYKREALSSSQSKVSLLGSETIIASGSDELTMKRTCTSVSCNGASSTSSRDSHTNGNSLKLNINSNGINVNSIKSSKGWISIKANGLKRNLGGSSKRPRMSEDVQGDCKMDSFDPFAFDEGDLEPSKWELLAKKKETPQTHQSGVTNGELTDGSKLPNMTANDVVLNRLTNEQNHHSCENSCPSVTEEDSNLLEECLLTLIKVLMNLTNDNPMGCQQIAACGGLDTMASLIISHFPSFDLCFPMNSQVRENNFSSDIGHPNNRHLSDHELDFLVAILGLLVNLVEKDSQNRLRLVSAHVSVNRPGKSESRQIHRDVIPLLCSIFLANQGVGVAAGEEKTLLCDDEDSLLQGEREAEMMIIEAYAALLLAFLSTESTRVRESIASCLPNHNLQVLVPVLERFVAFHLTLNMISPETHSAVVKVIESCKVP